MCGCVVLPVAAVVAVLRGVPRRDALLEPVQNVRPESRLVVVDEDGGGDVHRGDEHQALRDAGSGTTGLDVVGDVDDLLPFGGPEGSIVGMDSHRGDAGWLLSGAASMLRRKPLPAQ